MSRLLQAVVLVVPVAALKDVSVVHDAKRSSGKSGQCRVTGCRIAGCRIADCRVSDCGELWSGELWGVEF